MHRWKQRAVAIMVLCVLAGLPIATAICAAACETAEAAAAVATADHDVTSVPQHHHGAAHADHGTPTSAVQRMVSTTAHECGASDDALLQSEAARTPDRGDVHMIVIAQSPALASAAPQPLVSPPGLASDDSSRLARVSARTPLVLRV